jgi:hypothetical protein
LALNSFGMHIVIVTGTSSLQGGSGIFLDGLERQGYEIIRYRLKRSGIRPFIKRPSCWNAIILEIGYRLFYRLRSLFQFLRLIIDPKRFPIIILHQTTAISVVLALHFIKKKLIIYPLDNFFFCRSSYNFHHKTDNECLLCLGANLTVDDTCESFPLKGKNKSNDRLRGYLKKISRSIFFVCQNKLQAELVTKHYGVGTRTLVSGLGTENLIDSLSTHWKESCERVNTKVFVHIRSHGAKGLNTVLIAAFKLPTYSFYIPDSMPKVFAEGHDIPSNVIFHDIGDQSDLIERAVSASLVLVPSKWSAPIETSLIKSLLTNANVAVLESTMGFEREISSDVDLLVLDHRIETWDAKIKYYLSREIDYRKLQDSRIKFVRQHLCKRQFRETLNKAIKEASSFGK